MLIELLHVSIIAACLAVSVFYGRYMAKVFQGQKNLLSPIIRPIERAIYWICGIDESKEMTWKAYLGWYFVFEAVSIVFAFAVLTVAGQASPQSSGLWFLQMGCSAEHDSILFNQHRMAGLCRRARNELSVADARADRSGLLGPSGRTRLRHSPIPWLCPKELRYNRQHSGSILPDACSI